MVYLPFWTVASAMVPPRIEISLHDNEANVAASDDSRTYSCPVDPGTGTVSNVDNCPLPSAVAYDVGNQTIETTRTITRLTEDGIDSHQDVITWDNTYYQTRARYQIEFTAGATTEHALDATPVQIYLDIVDEVKPHIFPANGLLEVHEWQQDIPGVWTFTEAQVTDNYDGRDPEYNGNPNGLTCLYETRCPGDQPAAVQSTTNAADVQSRVRTCLEQKKKDDYYSVYITCNDTSGNTRSIEKKILFRDAQRPNINVNGPEQQEVQCVYSSPYYQDGICDDGIAGAVCYEDQNATAVDNYDALVPDVRPSNIREFYNGTLEDISTPNKNAFLSSGRIDQNFLKTYQIDYDHADNSGNQAVQKHRYVSVIDTTPPTIEFGTGDNPGIEEYQFSISEFRLDAVTTEIKNSVNCLDSCYGSLTNSPPRVRVDCDFSSAVRQTAHTFDFNDTTTAAPLLETFTGQQAQMEDNETRVGVYTYTCTCSEIRGDRTTAEEYPVDFVDGFKMSTNALESYMGNQATQDVTITIVDNGSPVVNVLGPANITLEASKYKTYTDDGATCSDHHTNAIYDATAVVTLDADNDNKYLWDTDAYVENPVGTVPDVTYNCANCKFNILYTCDTATSDPNTATRTVTVLDTKKPDVVIKHRTVQAEQVAVMPDSLPFVSDVSDIVAQDNLGSATFVRSVVDNFATYQYPSPYDIIYTYTDKNNNDVNVTRHVNVRDTTLPVIDLTLGALKNSKENDFPNTKDHVALAIAPAQSNVLVFAAIASAVTGAAMFSLKYVRRSPSIEV